MESGEGQSSSSSATTMTDSGVSGAISTTPKRRKVDDVKSTKESIICLLNDEIGKFGSLVGKYAAKTDRKQEDYRNMYRLYRTSLKALNLLQNEWNDLTEECEPLSKEAHDFLKSDNENYKVWSQFIYKNPSPTKIKRMKVAPSPSTERIGGLLHSIGSFVGLTAEALCSSKRRPENFESVEHLLKVTRPCINLLIVHRDQLVSELQPYIEQQGQRQESTPVV